eukprot:GHVT01019636.1.p2 GENE.GHVT01019636.1~~GHVT01019636.1.p2  ORF type:complete len:176 (+),score=33.94 GHVT01019636.1:1540-2067(+)
MFRSPASQALEGDENSGRKSWLSFDKAAKAPRISFAMRAAGANEADLDSSEESGNDDKQLLVGNAGTVLGSRLPKSKKRQSRLSRTPVAESKDSKRASTSVRFLKEDGKSGIFQSRDLRSSTQSEDLVDIDIKHKHITKNLAQSDSDGTQTKSSRIIGRPPAARPLGNAGRGQSS